MYHKKFSIFSFSLFVLFFLTPKTTYAYSCSLDFIYKPELVVAEAIEQEFNCESNTTTTTFKNLLTIKGNVPGQFKMETNIGKTGICKNPDGTDKILIINTPYGIPHPQFEKQKRYLMSTFPDTNNPSRFKPHTLCSVIFEEVAGPSDPKVLVSALVNVYTRPVWFSIVLIAFIPGILLASLLYKVFPDIVAFIISGITVLVLYGFLIFFLIKLIRKLVKKIRGRKD